MAVTITTGTSAPTTVTVGGDFVSQDHTPLQIYEQTASGTPTGSNSILLGSATTTHSGTSLSLDQNSDNFADVIVVRGFTSYIVGATGAVGDIYFVDNNGNIIAFGTGGGQMTNVVATGAT